MDRGHGDAQMVVLAPRTLIDRADALRIVMAEEGVPMNRARVLLAALEGKGLTQLEARYSARLNRLSVVARRAGMEFEQYVRAYADEHQRKSYAPTLEQLERIERE